MSKIISQVSTGLYLLVIFSLMSCGGSSTGSATASKEAAPKETKEEAAPKKNVMSFTEEDVAALKDKFIFDEASGYYYHKTWNRTFPKRRTLTADVTKTGYFILSSNYYGKGINHSKVTVKIDGKRMSTEGINRKDETEHQTSKAPDGSKWEVNTYSKYRDKGIFEAIGKTEGDVELTFIGPDATTKYEKVNNADIEAIKDCYQLSLLMRVQAAQ